MKRIWKILGTIVIFLTGFVLSALFIASMLLSSSYLTWITNDRELIYAGGTLIGLLVARWWYKNTPPII